MQAHDRLHDGQPQPRAALGTGTAAVGAVKAFEQVWQVVSFDPTAGVAHRQRDAVVVAFHQQQHRGALGRVANRVGQQVGNRPLDHQAIALDPGVAAQAQGHAFVFGAQGEQRHDPLRFGTQRHRVETRPCSGVADLGEKQHVGDDARQAFHFLGAGFQPGLVGLAGTLAGQGHLGLAHEVGQWRAQFVGEVIGELRQLLHTGVEAMQHEVDAFGQLAQLLGQVVQRQTVCQVLGTDLGCHAAELLQRREPTLHQPPGAHADQEQQHRQRDHRGAQVGTEQGLIIGAVQRQQHAHIFAAAQRHQPRGTEDAIAAPVHPIEVGQGLAGGHVEQQRLLGLGTDAE